MPGSSAGCSREPRAEAVDAEPAGERGEPGPERVVVPERAQALVRPGEGLLEDVLGVRVGKPEGLGDREDVAGVALDDEAPGLVVAGAAARDELGVGELHKSIKQDRRGQS